MLLLGFVTGVLLTTGSVYLLAVWKHPKKKVDVPVTHTLTWWPFQEKLEITSFDIRVVDEHLNLLKSNATVEYTIEGSLKQSHDRKSYIKQVHMSEKLISKEPLQGAEIEITITPVVGQKKTEGSVPETTTFRFTNRQTLHSVAWGKHKFRFICGNFEETIELIQRK